MRSITLKHKEKKKRKNQFILGGILILIMLFSVVGYSFSGNIDNKEKYKYNGIEFIKESGVWISNFNGFQFLFKYNPSQIENFNSQLNLLENYYNKPLYIYSENPEAEIEIYQNLFYYNGIVQRVQKACLDDQCSEDFPIKTCEDNFIIIKEGEVDRITQENKCVFIEGKKEDLIKMSDSFLYKIIGITQ